MVQVARFPLASAQQAAPHNICIRPARPIPGRIPSPSDSQKSALHYVQFTLGLDSALCTAAWTSSSQSLSWHSYTLWQWPLNQSPRAPNTSCFPSLAWQLYLAQIVMRFQTAALTFRHDLAFRIMNFLKTKKPQKFLLNKEQKNTHFKRTQSEKKYNNS